MKLPKIILYGIISLFVVIGLLGLFKGKKQESKTPVVRSESIEEIAIEMPKEEAPTLAVEEKVAEVSADVEKEQEVDKIDLLFTTDASKLPVVETVTYSSRVPWLKGRPAWIADYASHYETTRHFIARGLNRTRDYFTQKVSPGDRFNVLRKDIPVEFHLLIDLSQCKMKFYALNKEANERYLLKTYNVGLGRKETKRTSGFLTPMGKYQLGSKVAIYGPKSKGYFQDQQIEMIKVFGTRWIPFEKEISGCSDVAKGYGIHGVPWIESSDGQLTEEVDRIGKYDSDGCIRLAAEDIEEIFAIVISKPTMIEIVKDFQDAEMAETEIK